jgi:predicted nucleic acid-binding protein
MRVGLGTNILVYAEGVNGEARLNAALEIISRLPREATLIPVQVLGELFRVPGRQITDLTKGRPGPNCKLAGEFSID